MKRKDNVERDEAIVRMRLEEHLPLREIGDHFGISHERVRQIVGNTGYVVSKKFDSTLNNEEWLESTKHLTNKQVSEMLGANGNTVSGCRSHFRHAVRGKGKILYEWQNRISQMLTDMGIQNTQKPYMQTPHITTSNGIRINVRVSNSVRKTNENIVSPQYKFNVKKKNVDFYVLVALGIDKCFIIPIERTGNMEFALFCYPSLRERLGNRAWQDYANRWDLIMDAENEKKK